MSEKEILSELETLLDADANTLHPQDALNSLSKWDSLAIISFMAIADEKFGALVSPRALEKATHVSDLISLIQNSKDT